MKKTLFFILSLLMLMPNEAICNKVLNEPDVVIVLKRKDNNKSNGSRHKVANISAYLLNQSVHLYVSNYAGEVLAQIEDENGNIISSKAFWVNGNIAVTSFPYINDCGAYMLCITLKDAKYVGEFEL